MQYEDTMRRGLQSADTVPPMTVRNGSFLMPAHRLVGLRDDGSKLP